MGRFLGDARYAVRLLAKSPGFTAMAVLALGIGIGASTAIFSIINAVILRPLPFRDADRIVTVWGTKPAENRYQLAVSDRDYTDWVDQSRVFEGMAAIRYLRSLGSSFTAGREPEYVIAGEVSAGFFSVMGSDPLVGRGFLAEEDVRGGPAVMLLSQRLWQTRLGGSAEVIGRSVRLDGTSYTVVGVARSEIRSLLDADVFVPIRIDSTRPRQDRRIGVVARLRPGVSLIQAQAEMDVVSARLAQEFPATNQGYGARVVRLAQLASSLIGPALWILLGAVVLLLLIGCCNVANLLLARATSRQKEIALRAALGASRVQIVRQLLAESLLLGLAGGVAGVVTTAWSLRLMRGLPTELVPRLNEASVDGRVLVFTLVLSLVTVLVFGLWPAVRMSKTSPSEALKEGGVRGVLPGGSQRSQTVLLGAEVALALILAVGAGLMLRSFARLMATDPRVRTEKIFLTSLGLQAEKYREMDAQRLFVERVLDRVRTLPEVTSACGISGTPPLELTWVGLKPRPPFYVLGRPAPPVGQEPSAYFRRVSIDFFRTLDIPLVQGRVFTERDSHDALRVAIVSQALARQYFPGEDPIGKRVRSYEEEREIVGVVQDVKLYGLDDPFEPAMYVPYAQLPAPRLTLIIGTATDPTAISEAVRKAVLAVDAEQAVSEPTTMEERYSKVTLPRRLSTGLFGVFAVLALALAMVGIYGLTSYLVSQRTHEFGLRMALGAERRDLLRMVVGKGIAVALVGALIGLAGAVALTRLMKRLLYGVSTTDPIVFSAVALLLVAVTAVASYVPARRAAGVDPMVALRHE